VTEEVKIFIIIVVAVIVAYPLYIKWVMKTGGLKTQRTKDVIRAVEQNTTVVAMLVKIKAYSYDSDRVHGMTNMQGQRYIGAYQYCVNGKQYKKKIAFQDESPPKQVTLYYLPQKPQKSYYDGDAVQISKNLGCVTYFLPIIIGFIVLVVLLKIR
jgi:hypothetical protein